VTSVERGIGSRRAEGRSRCSREGAAGRRTCPDATSARRWRCRRGARRLSRRRVFGSARPPPRRGRRGTPGCCRQRPALTGRPGGSRPDNPLPRGSVWRTRLQRLSLLRTFFPITRRRPRSGTGSSQLNVGWYAPSHDRAATSRSGPPSVARRARFENRDAGGYSAVRPDRS